MHKTALFFASLFCAVAAHAGTNNVDIAVAARRQIGVTVKYNAAYTPIPYPNGDISRESGACTDVVIRALRDARKFDLQKHVHEDMRLHFREYPRDWGLDKPDRNIDHRRVPNLKCFFTRKGWSRPVTKNPADYDPGDIVTVTLGRTIPHIMVVSDRKSPAGRPMIVHNIGSGVKEEDVLFAFTITGHFRMK